jgi:hypothetical protein
MPSAHIPLYASVESLQWEAAVAYFAETESRLARGGHVCYARAVGLAFVNTPIASYADLFGFIRLRYAWVKHVDWVLCEEAANDTCLTTTSHTPSLKHAKSGKGEFTRWCYCYVQFGLAWLSCQEQV